MHDTHDKKAVSFLLFTSFVLLGIMIFLLVPKDVTAPVEENSQESSQRALISAPKFGTTEPEALFIEFGDFQCPACKTISQHVSTLEEEFGDRVQFIWIHAINSAQHQFARTAAVAAQCAHEQNKFKSYHDLLFENQDELGPNLYAKLASDLQLSLPAFNTCLSSDSTLATIVDHQRFAEVSRVEQTPTVAINDKFISGDLTLENLRTELEEALKVN